jgi:trehalose 6-phosphate phosphatase
VFELRPPVDINKGTVLAQLVRQHALNAAVFLGDDTTDADALAVARRLRRDGTCYTVGIGVASAHTPPSVHENADLLLPDVQAVESFLDWLLNARRASST